MDKDPRLIARSETHQGTQFIRPETARPKQDDALVRAPQIDTDELLRARDEELASGTTWRVRMGHEDLWWDSIGGYTPYSANAKKWASRWDAYNVMIKQHTGYHRWSIEPVPTPGRVAAGLAGGARFADLSQAWTRSVPSAPGGTLVPEDALVHAVASENMPTWALCGTQVGHWVGSAWPPRAMKRCERCNSIAVTLPG